MAGGFGPVDGLWGIGRDRFHRMSRGEGGRRDGNWDHASSMQTISAILQTCSEIPSALAGGASIGHRTQRRHPGDGRHRVRAANRYPVAAHDATRNGVVVGAGEPPAGSSVTALCATLDPAGTWSNTRARPC